MRVYSDIYFLTEKKNIYFFLSAKNNLLTSTNIIKLNL